MSDENQSGEGRFSKSIVDALAKRAASRCSNPECNAVTTGPAEDVNKAVIVGEAAHIFGANIGSARYDAAMLPAERAEITNGIWLCRNCHKIIDSDVDRFPATLLFAWRAKHEMNVSSQLGKTNEILRRQIVEVQISKLGDIGDIAQQALIDKPAAWEFLLTAEVLRHKCRKTLVRWNALKKGLYSKPLKRIESEQAIVWMSDRLLELPGYIQAAVAICNSEFQIAWGAPGVSGSAEMIVETCSLFGEVCESLLQWEETVRFTRLPTEFEEVLTLMTGAGGRALEQISSLNEQISNILPMPDAPLPSEIHKIVITVDLPPDWQNEMENAVDRLKIRLHLY